MFACKSLCNRMGLARNRKQPPLSRIYTEEQIDRGDVSLWKATFILRIDRERCGQKPRTKRDACCPVSLAALAFGLINEEGRWTGVGTGSATIHVPHLPLSSSSRIKRSYDQVFRVNWTNHRRFSKTCCKIEILFRRIIYIYKISFTHSHCLYSVYLTDQYDRFKKLKSS